MSNQETNQIGSHVQRGNSLSVTISFKIAGVLNLRTYENPTTKIVGNNVPTIVTIQAHIALIFCCTFL